MQRWLNMMTHAQTTMVWDRWHLVLESEKYAGEVMIACLNRISKAAFGQGWNKWTELVKELRKGDAEPEYDALQRKLVEPSAGREQGCVTAQPVLIRAGPGTGKVWALVH